MEHHLQFVRAKPEDAASIVDVHYQAVQAISSEFYDSEIIKAWSPTPIQERIEKIKNAISNPGIICVVAVENNTIGGFAIFSVDKKFLQAIYVLPSMQGRGIGAELLKYIEKEATYASIETIELKSSLNAQSFYEHAGYKKICASAQQLNDNLAMQSITMRKNL